MKLDLDMVAQGLAAALPVRVYGPAGGEPDLEGLRFFTGQSAPGPLYLLDGAWPPAGFSGCTLCRNPQGSPPEGSACRVLAVYIDEDLQALANRVLEVFDRYNAWDSRLQQGVKNNADLRELAGIGSEMLGGRVLVSDKKLRLLADSHFYKADGLSPEDFQGQMLPDHVVRTILAEDLPPQRSAFQPYLAGRLGQYGDNPVYCVDLCIGGRREGTCALMPDGHPLPSFALPLFQHFVGYIAQSFVFHQGTTGRDSRPLRQLVEELLQSDRLTARQIQEVRRYHAAFSGCRCAVVEVPAGRQFSLEYLRFFCEELLAGSIALIRGEQVVVLLPNEADPALLHSQLDSLTDGCVGISDTGRDLADCVDLYRQACAALQLGPLSRPGDRWFSFPSVRLEYLTQTCLAPQPQVMVRTAGFQRLLDHNARSSADYVDTLRVWLDHEMHITESAEALYLHRSSFLKRLDKLQELLGEELQTPDGRLLLRLQLALLK